MATADGPPALGPWLRARLALVLSGFGPGVVLGALALPIATLVTGDAAGMEATAFGAGSLVFGFALLGWSGSILAGAGIENMQRHLDTGSDWSEQDSRRAMARIGGFGAGLMVGVSVVASVFRGLGIAAL